MGEIGADAALLAAREFLVRLDDLRQALALVLEAPWIFQISPSATLIRGSLRPKILLEIPLRGTVESSRAKASSACGNASLL
jgi:hypothetical protein